MDDYETGRFTTANPKVVRTRKDLAAFVEAMSADLAATPDEWENSTLPRYLDALGSFIGSIDGYYRNVLDQQLPDQPSWELVAQFLAAASGYE